jgi:hypothetical protein
MVRSAPTVDGILLQWGSVLFEGTPKRYRGAEDPWLPTGWGRRSVGEIRDEIRALTRHSPQVMVKIISNQSDMGAVRKVLKYISLDHSLTITDELQDQYLGAEATLGLGEQFKYAGLAIPEADGKWRETFHIEAGMPRGTIDGKTLHETVQAFAAAEFSGHKYAWTFHDHQEHPHVHLLVRIVDCELERLNPRKADLQRWRETFAHQLRLRGVEARATRRVTRGVAHAGQPLWSIEAKEQGRLGMDRGARLASSQATMLRALTAWGHVHNALAHSADAADRLLAKQVRDYLASTPMVRHMAQQARVEQQQRQQQDSVQPPQAHKQGRNVARR